MSTDEWFFPVSSVFHSSWACFRGTAPTGPTPPGVMSRTPGRFSLWRVAMAVWRPARSWARNKHKQPLRGSSAVALWQRRPSLRAAGGKVMWLGTMVSCMRSDGWLRVHLRPGSVEDVPISFTPCTASMMLAEVCAIPNAGSVKLLADPFCEKHPMCAQALGGFVPKHGSKVVLFVYFSSSSLGWFFWSAQSDYSEKWFSVQTQGLMFQIFLGFTLHTHITVPQAGYTGNCCPIVPWLNSVDPLCVSAPNYRGHLPRKKACLGVAVASTRTSRCEGKWEASDGLFLVGP